MKDFNISTKKLVFSKCIKIDNGNNQIDYYQ